MEIELLLSAVTTVGFPIAVCAFLLYERRQNSKELQDVVIANTVATKELSVLIREKLQ